MSTTLVIDYGMGNIGSVRGALNYLGEDVLVTGDPETVTGHRRLILPGVGSFSGAMDNLEKAGLADAIRVAVLDRGARILGVCLGMQLLAEYGQEGGGRPGIGLVPGRVIPLSAGPDNGHSLHIGFSTVSYAQPGVLYEAIPTGTDFYFVHEYHLVSDEIESEWDVGFSNHGETVIASYERENIMGVQFHPEKSQTNGLALLKNFLER